MAASCDRMNKAAYLAKQKCLQDLKNDYILKLEDFLKDVETSMQSQNKDKANENFETAVDFLTQPFPDVQNMKADPVDDVLMFKQEVSKVSKKLDSVNTKFESFRAQTAIRLKKINTRLDETNEHLKSLKKLQKIFKSKIETVPSVLARTTSNTAMTATFPSPGATPKVTVPTLAPTVLASPEVTPTEAATPSTPFPGVTSASGPHRSLCERRNFSVESRGERFAPDIEDVLLLSETLLVMTDSRNKSVKLYTEQGGHLHSLKLSSDPRRLALIDSGPGNTWKVAVTLPMDQRIAILEVTPDFVTQLTSIQTSCQCWAITAVDTATLAVGYYAMFHRVPGIDLIDMTGRVLRRLSESLHPCYMTVTQDGCLFMSSSDNSVAKVRIQDSQIIFKKTGESEPQGKSKDYLIQ
ncbi:hypothetical protein RRG08_051136 [Elysia crispata]|uniref:Uncharacterized protein n=1 Tax=Elysia crispata TaxID=231223 RepID=A0AAE1B8P6_9GAST|nr:hypothetical protein RRG08_051136 [Elysia crispata]